MTSYAAVTTPTAILSATFKYEIYLKECRIGLISVNNLYSKLLLYSNLYLFILFFYKQLMFWIERLQLVLLRHQGSSRVSIMNVFKNYLQLCQLLKYYEMNVEILRNLFFGRILSIKIVTVKKLVDLIIIS